VRRAFNSPRTVSVPAPGAEKSYGLQMPNGMVRRSVDRVAGENVLRHELPGLSIADHDFVAVDMPALEILHGDVGSGARIVETAASVPLDKALFAGFLGCHRAVVPNATSHDPFGRFLERL
jgi:hypothetical protein